MGVIYRAEHLNLRRRAAIKVIAQASGSAIEGMRGVAAAARRPRVLLGGVAANTRAVARLARLAMPFSPLRLEVKLRKLLGPEAVGG